MWITNKSILDGKEYKMDLDVTNEQLSNYLNQGMLVQDAFPHLTPGEREFIINGITPEAWDEVFGEEDDDE